MATIRCASGQEDGSIRLSTEIRLPNASPLELQEVSEQLGTFRPGLIGYGAERDGDTRMTRFYMELDGEVADVTHAIMGFRYALSSLEPAVPLDDIIMVH